MSNLELIKQHDEGTMICSFQNQMRSSSPTYNQIVEKGESIVPDILQYLRDNDGGMSIMLLLWDILKISPYQPETVKGDDGEEIGGLMGFNVSESRQAWLDWGIEKGLIKIDDTCEG